MPDCRDDLASKHLERVANEARYLRTECPRTAVDYLESEFWAYHQREAAGTPQAVGTASEGKKTKCRN